MVNLHAMAKRALKTLVALLPFLLGSSVSLTAEFYRWVDQNGVVHFTDNLHNIPQKHRDGATRIKRKDSPRAQESPQTAAPTKASIPIFKHGEVVIVEAKVNQKAVAKFVVDTGASYTMISVATAKELEIEIDENRPTMPFHTANGVIRAPLITLESIEIGGMEVKDLTAAIHDALPDPTISGLLGLNFLNKFRIDIDTDKSILYLEKK